MSRIFQIEQQDNVIQLPGCPNYKETIAILEAEIARLQQTIQDLTGNKAQTVESKPIYSWVEFVNAGTERIGKTRGFQQKFLNAFPEYKWGDIAKWRRLGVPASVMARVATMEVTQTDQDYGKDWSDRERDMLRVVMLTEPRIKGRDLAERLSAQFGRTITEGAVKGAKQRLLGYGTKQSG